MSQSLSETVTTDSRRSVSQRISGLASLALLLGVVLPWRYVPEEASDAYLDLVSSEAINRFGRLQALVLGLIMLSLFRWNPKRNAVGGLVIGALVVAGALLVNWFTTHLGARINITWTPEGPPDWWPGIFVAGIGLTVTRVGLAIVAIAGISWALPDAKRDSA